MSEKSIKLTPLMKQYWDVKTAHPDCVLFFRMGDFFELFYEDAILVSRICGLHLTQRNKKAEDETPMCGMPHFSIAPHINKLLRAGYKIALCDQIEDPKMAKGIVRRAVTQILTPGIVYDPATLDEKKPHWIVCRDEQSLAALDATSGEALWIEGADLDQFEQMLIVAERVPLQVESSEQDLRRWLPREAPPTARSLLIYVSRVQPRVLQCLQEFRKRDWLQGTFLSPTALSQLEVFSSSSGEAGTLFESLDLTRMAAGARLLREWLSFPLRDREKIEARQKQVQNWMQRPQELKTLRGQLGEIGDLERKLTRLAGAQGGPQDLKGVLESIERCMDPVSSLGLTEPFRELFQKIQKFLQQLLPEQPLVSTQGHIFRRGVFAHLDELIDLSENMTSILAQMEAQEKEQTGIGSLKIRYNQVFGYYIEVTNTHLAKVPTHYKRKQTLTNAERFYTDALLDLERKVLSSQIQRAAFEKQEFDRVVQDVLQDVSQIQRLTHLLAEQDVLASFAWLALERNYVRPVLFDQKDRRIEIVRSRHPVLERLPGVQFQENSLSWAVGEVLLLTGPNMAGKSTLMRQVALIAIMAQVGCFVPAEKAELFVFDRILTRIGAQDQLIKGRSTFMVEMIEMAEAVEHSTDRSLLLLDEIGRGTSTYDGLSLAQAFLEYFLKSRRALVLFATHYHELTQLQDPGLSNAHLSIEVKSQELRFLHQLKSGPAGRSYGVQVAKQAGVPDAVVQRAQKLLQQFEAPQQLSLAPQIETVPLPESPLEHLEVVTRLSNVDVNRLTPLQGLQVLSELQHLLKASTQEPSPQSGTVAIPLKKQDLPLSQ